PLRPGSVARTGVHPMNPELDRLERELETLRPRGVSARLRQRIGERLGHQPRATPVPFWPLLAGGLAAAAAVVGRIWWPVWRGNQLPGPDVGRIGPAARVSQAADAVPSMGAYQAAFAESPEALDALLATHAARFGGAGPAAVGALCDPT